MTTIEWAVVVAATSVLGAPPYAAVKGEAEAVPNLGRYLELYLGDCLSDDPEFDGEGCEAKAAAFRKAHFGETITFEFEDVADILAFGGWDERRKAYRMLLTPFFSGRELALTVGQPSARRKDGLPSVPNLPIWVRLPDGEPEFTFRRKLERQMVRLEMVVAVGKPWTLRRRGGKGLYRGVETKLKAVRLVGARRGEVLAEQTYP